MEWQHPEALIEMKGGRLSVFGLSVEGAETKLRFFEGVESAVLYGLSSAGHIKIENSAGSRVNVRDYVIEA